MQILAYDSVVFDETPKNRKVLVLRHRLKRKIKM